MTTTILTLNPEQTALLVMDYQRAILTRLPDADQLVQRMATSIGVARKGGLQTGYVWVGFEDADYAAISASSPLFAAIVATRRLSVQDPETAIHDAVAPASGDIVVRKTRVGAFS